MRHLKDKAAKVLCVPMLGLAIPNLTGLIHNGRYSLAGISASYLYFIFIALVVWEGNVQMMYFIKKKLQWRHRRYHTIILSLVLCNIIYSGTVSCVMLGLWELISKESFDSPAPIAYSALLIIGAAIFITNIYQIVSLNNEKEFTLSRVEQLNALKAQSELEALKNQLDPHFIFNSLNTLSFLITREPERAKMFNDTLAKVYRYILTNKDKDLVMLKEEIEFICNYFFLMKIRFRDAIDMEIEINDLSSDDFLIPPISLQALIENAIKHNDFSDKRPLGIFISVSSNNIDVKNAVLPKAYLQPGQKSGLVNLGLRFQLITKRNVIIENRNNIFSVRLPILKI